MHYIWFHAFLWICNILASFNIIKYAITGYRACLHFFFNLVPVIHPENKRHWQYIRNITAQLQATHVAEQAYIVLDYVCWISITRILKQSIDESEKCVYTQIHSNFIVIPLNSPCHLYSSCINFPYITSFVQLSH